MKIFLDSNVLLRYFLKDNPSQFEFCKKLISEIEEGKFKPYISGIILLEISYVLKSVYKLPFKDIIEVLDSILALRGLTIKDKLNTKLAMEWYKKYKIKFSDCMIASQLAKEVTLISFDEEFNKISGINVRKPQEV